MNGTFMFGHDRFGDDEDFHATYRRLGGKALSDEEVHGFVRSCGDEALRCYADSSCFDSFPSIGEVLARDGRLSRAEALLIEHTIAHHELGQVPDWAAAALRALAQKHRIGLVTNIWSKKAPWLAEFERAGIGDVFEVMVFSSDSRSIKPSPRIFRTALGRLNAEPHEVVFACTAMIVLATMKTSSPRIEGWAASFPSLARCWPDVPCRPRCGRCLSNRRWHNTKPSR